MDGREKGSHRWGKGERMIGKGREKGREGRRGCRELCLMLMERCGKSCVISQTCYMSKREKSQGEERERREGSCEFLRISFQLTSLAPSGYGSGASFLMLGIQGVLLEEEEKFFVSLLVL